MPSTRKINSTGPCPLHAKSIHRGYSNPRTSGHISRSGGSGIYKSKRNDVPTFFKVHTKSNVGLGTKSLAQIVVLGLLRLFFRRHCPHHPNHRRHEAYRLVPRGCERLDICGYISTACRKGYRGDQDLNDMHRTRVARHFHRWLFQKSLEKVASRRSSAFTDPWECPSAER